MRSAQLKSRAGLRLKLTLAIGLVIAVFFLAMVFLIDDSFVPLFRASMEEQISYENQEIMARFVRLRETIDEYTMAIVTGEAVQASLVEPMPDDMYASDVFFLIRSYLIPPVKLILYRDQHTGAVFAPSLPQILAQDFEAYPFMRRLDDSYARPNYFVLPDDFFFETGRDALFVVTRARHLIQDVAPGVLVYMLDWEAVLKDLGVEAARSARTILLDREGNAVYDGGAGRYRAAIDRAMALNPGKRVKCRQDGAYIAAETDARTGWTVAMAVGDDTLLAGVNDTIRRIFILGVALFALCNLALFVSTNYLIRPVEAEVTEAQNKLKVMEMHSLYNQIAPHFLYNILDNLYMMARMSENAELPQMIFSLSNFLKIGISKGASEIPLARELEHVRAYLEIQKIRYASLFAYEIDCGPGAGEVSVPKVFLQPIVENCIVHGFADMRSGGRIEIRASRAGARVRIEVLGNGLPIDPAAADRLNRSNYIDAADVPRVFPKKEGGYGMGNVFARLNLFYGQTYNIRYENADGRTRCRIELPAGR